MGLPDLTPGDEAKPLWRGRLALALLAGAAVLALAAPFAHAIVNKPFIKPITTEPPPGTKVDIDAAQIAYDGRRKIATATGSVRMVYGPYTLIATKVVYDEVKDTFTANGSVELREPNGNVLQASQTVIFNRFKEGFAKHIKALLSNDATITAVYARRELNGITTFERATYTACKDCQTKSGKPLWEITTTKTIHDSNKHDLYFYDPTLRIGDVPVFWLPYAQQPDPSVARRTGFLIPNYKYGNLYGFGVITPYFVTLGDSADLTLSPVWTTEQGPVADIEYRQRTKTGQFNIRGYGVYELNEDDFNGVYLGKPLGPGRRSRGAVTSTGDFAPSATWAYGWDGTLVSDRQFLDRYDFDDRQYAVNYAYVRNIDDRTYFNARALHFQSLNQYDYQDRMPYALPYIDSEMTFDQPILGGELGFDWSVYSIHRSSNDPYFYDQPSPFVVPTTLNTGSDLDEGTDQTRAVGILRWQRQMTSDFGTVFTPFARVRSDVYVTNNVPDPVTGLNQDSDVVSRVLPSAGFDLRWPFIANYEMGQSIITPVLQTVIATDETDTDSIGNEDAISVNFDSTSLFLNDRFTGLDRYEGGSRANVGVQYSFLASNGGFARLSAGESFHIAGKNSFGLDTGLEGSKSDLVGAATIQPWDWLSFNYQVRMEENLSQINTQEGFVNFAFSKLSGSFGYMNLHEEAAFGRNESLEQVDGALSYQFDEAWRLFGGLRYDLNNDKFLLKYAGIGFDCDCMAASVTYSESEAATAGSELDRTLRLSVELRTIGATSFTVSR